VERFDFLIRGVGFIERFSFMIFRMSRIISSLFLFAILVCFFDDFIKNGQEDSEGD